MTSSPQLAPGQVFAADFVVTRKLAEGGMGSLYVVEQRSTGEQRALKLMLPQLLSDPRLVERFLQEARVGARIRSEHVVKVVAAGVDADSGAPWYAMELLEGADLDATVRARGALPPGEVLDYLQQVCHALGMAHAAGIIHRDLKPENLFLARSQRADGRPTVKVLDFGIAKMLQENRTSAASTGVLGTPLWMAPEQSTAETVRPTADVWALALIAFYLLTGRSYWRGAHAETFNLQGLFREVLIDPLVPASQRARELGAGALPPGFDAFFARCTDRDPLARPRDAAEFASLLAPALAAGASIPPTRAFSATELPPAPTPAPQPAHAVTHPAFAAATPAGPAATHPAFAASQPLGFPQTNAASTPPTTAMSAFAPPTPPPASSSAVPLRPSSRKAWFLLPLGVFVLAGGALLAQQFTGRTRHTHRRDPVAEQPEPSAAVAEHFVEPPIRLALAPRPAPTHTEPHPPAPAPAPPPAAPEAPPATEADPALARATACAHGDHHCVIAALRGNATTEPALAMLIAAERQAGDSAAAQAAMRRYLQRFPSGPRAAAYNAQLGAASATSNNASAEPGVQLLDTQGSAQNRRPRSRN